MSRKYRVMINAEPGEFMQAVAKEAYERGQVKLLPYSLSDRCHGEVEMFQDGAGHFKSYFFSPCNHRFLLEREIIRCQQKGRQLIAIDSSATKLRRNENLKLYIENKVPFIMLTEHTSDRFVSDILKDACFPCIVDDTYDPAEVVWREGMKHIGRDLPEECMPMLVSSESNPIIGTMQALDFIIGKLEHRTGHTLYSMTDVMNRNNQGGLK